MSIFTFSFEYTFRRFVLKLAREKFYSWVNKSFLGVLYHIRSQEVAFVTRLYFFEKMISESEMYEYLGVTMDKNLTMKAHLEKTYKKVLSRTKLLARIRHNISPWVAETIYKVMILPQMLYSSNIMLGMSNTHKLQFERIRIRVLAIINGKSQRVILPTVNHARNKRCLVEVFKCQNGLAPRLFKDYLKKILHHKETRENNKNLLLPKVRTEAGRKSFLFQGSKLYNKLPDALKQEQSIMNFKRQCDQLDSEFNF